MSYFYVMFGSSLLPVVCRRVHVLFTLYVCLVRLYFQLFVGGFMSYLHYVWFVFTSSCLQEGSCLINDVWFVFTSSLQEGSCLIYVMFGSSLLPVVCRRVHVLFTLCLVRLYFQLFVGGFMFYLRYMFVWFVFTSSCLQEGSCLIYVIYVCLVRLYFQLFVGGFMSY